MNLVMYSGGFAPENVEMAKETARLLKKKRNPVVAFIPGDIDDAEADFAEFKRTLAGRGVKKFLCMPIDVRLSAEQKKELFACDAIFLGGGNTFYILHHLRSQRLLHRLRLYVKNGGILMGLSAGSILMTPNVMTAQVPSYESDENHVGIEDLRALSLVNFEFSPHYEPSRKVDSELLTHSKNVEQPIYACADGQGIVVQDGQIRFVGQVTVFHRGAKYTLQ